VFQTRCGVRDCTNRNVFTNFERFRFHMRRDHKLYEPSDDKNSFYKCDLCEYECGEDEKNKFKIHYIKHASREIRPYVNEIECIFHNCDYYKTYAKKNYYSHIDRNHDIHEDLLKKKFLKKLNEQDQDNQDIFNDMQSEYNEQVNDMDTEHVQGGQKSKNNSTAYDDQIKNRFNYVFDRYMRTYMKYRNVFHIPKYQCDEIFQDIFNFFQDELETYKLVIPATLKTYDINEELHNPIINQIEHSNSFTMVHKQLKSESQKPMLR
jgi:hypothetical protein